MSVDLVCGGHRMNLRPVGSTTVRVACKGCGRWGFLPRAPNQYLPRQRTVGGGSGIRVSCIGALAYGSAQDMPHVGSFFLKF